MHLNVSFVSCRCFTDTAAVLPATTTHDALSETDSENTGGADATQDE